MRDPLHTLMFRVARFGQACAAFQQKDEIDRITANLYKSAGMIRSLATIGPGTRPVIWSADLKPCRVSETEWQEAGRKVLRTQLELHRELTLQLDALLAQEPPVPDEPEPSSPVPA